MVWCKVVRHRPFQMAQARQASQGPDEARHLSVSRPFWPASPFAPRSKPRIERVLGVQRAEEVFCGAEDAVQLLRQVLWYLRVVPACGAYVPYLPVILACWGYPVLRQMPLPFVGTGHDTRWWS